MATENETLRDFLSRRERELRQQISALSAEIANRQAELDEILRVLPTIGITRAEGHTNVQTSPDKQFSVDSFSAALVAAADMGQKYVDAAAVANKLVDAEIGRFQWVSVEAADLHPFAAFQGMTIKELIVKALGEHFRDGASAAELVEFISNAYDRKVERQSLSPQLSRLSRDGYLNSQADGKWILARGRMTAAHGYLLAQDEPPTKEDGDPK